MNWFRGRCFDLVHRNQLIYNTCWEDPRLDRQALRLSGDDVVVMITSAGCNALDYALESPQRIVAVDLNPRQNALLELKIAGIRALDFERFFAMFGEGRLADFRQVYERELRPELQPATRQYWDKHQSFFTGERRGGSFYFRGTSGYFAWMINMYIDRVAKVRDSIDAAFDAPSIDAQRKIYESDLHPAFWRPYLKWILRRDSTLSLLGVPRPQREQIDQMHPGGVADFIEDSIRTVFAELPLTDNYFWRVYLKGRYSRDCCPDYLREENFQKLKSGLVDRIDVRHCSVADYLETCQHPVTRLVLLDHMDWLSRNNCRALQQEWQAILRAAAPEARLLWRSAGYSSAFVDRIEVDHHGRKQRIGDMLHYNRELAEELHKVDRVHTYGSFYIADLAA